MKQVYTLICKNYTVEVWTNAEELIDSLNINQHIDYYLLAGEEKPLARPALSLLVNLLRKKTAMYCYFKDPGPEGLNDWRFKIEVHKVY